MLEDDSTRNLGVATTLRAAVAATFYASLNDLNFSRSSLAIGTSTYPN